MLYILLINLEHNLEQIAKYYFSEMTDTSDNC